MKKDYISNQDILTAKYVSAYMHIPLRTIYHLTKQGKIKGFKIGKHWRYRRRDVEDCFSLGIDFSKEPSRTYDNFCMGFYENKKLVERREYPRMNCHVECNYSIDLPEKGKIVKGTITNISGNGLLLCDKYNIDNVNTEDPVRLEFQLNSNGGNKCIIESEGRVVRKKSDRFGIKFRNLNKQYKDLIIRFIG